MIEIERRKNAMQDRYGKEICQDYGWAYLAFSNSTANRKITFFDLEKKVGLDHWRPRYRWASQHTHAGMRDMNSLLAETESKEPIILVGESNSGFVEPLQMTALHMSSITTLLVLTKPSVDALIMAKSIDIIAKETANIATQREWQTWEKAQT